MATNGGAEKVAVSEAKRRSQATCAARIVTVQFEVTSNGSSDAVLTYSMALGPQLVCDPRLP